MENIPTNSISRQFKGIWIPAEIWLDKSINYFERCLLAEIHSLENNEGCFASNEYLAEFFNERIRKIQEGISILKSRGYLAVKSFDGRQRILVTSLNPNIDKSLFSMSDMRTSDVRNSAWQECGNPHPSSYNIDTSIEQNTSLKVPEEPTAGAVMSAKADEIDSSPPLKKIKEVTNPEIKYLAVALLTAMRDVKPDYKEPSSTAAIETQLDLMLRRDGRKPQEILDVFRWALSDPFWCDKMFKPNPAKYLREKFDQFHLKMKSPTPQKERKFAPSADIPSAKEKMKEMRSRAIT